MKKYIASNQSYIIAIVLTIALIGWISTGTFSSSASAKNIEQNPESSTTAESSINMALNNSQSENYSNSTSKKLTNVRIKKISATDLNPKICVSSKSEPSRMVDIKAETTGKVEQIFIKKGQHVKKGDKLLQIELRDRIQRKKQAEALVKQAELEYQVAKKLYKKSFSTETKLAAANTQLESAKSQLKMINIEIENTTIKAPFDGIILSTNIEIGDFVSPGSTVANIIDNNPIIFSGDISEQDISRISLGYQAQADLIIGKKIDGKIRFISPKAKEATRTFRVEVEAENPDHDIPAGVSTELCIDTKSVKAHKISPAFLSLDDEGNIGVKTVSNNDTVKFYKVDIVTSSSNETWVSGLPDNIDIITVGQGFVSDGEKVNPSPASSTENDGEQ